MSLLSHDLTQHYKQAQKCARKTLYIIPRNWLFIICNYLYTMLHSVPYLAHRHNSEVTFGKETILPVRLLIHYNTANGSTLIAHVEIKAHTLMATWQIYKTIWTLSKGFAFIFQYLMFMSLNLKIFFYILFVTTNKRWLLPTWIKRN